LVAAGRTPPEDMGQALANIDLARARSADAPFVDDLRSALANRGAVDYPAMLEHATDLLETAWLRRQLSTLYSDVVVDEAQNLTRAQYSLLTRLVGEPSTTSGMRAMLVGDERQSIVGFAGADAGLIREFEQQYSAERIVLGTNYRSAGQIVAAGDRVADALGISSTSTGQTYAAPGSVEYQELSSEVEEGRFLASWVQWHLEHGIDPDALAPGEPRAMRPSDIAVLARAAAALRSTKSELEDRRIPVAMSVSPEDWVRTPAARLTTEVIAHRAAPGHLSVRRAISALCGGEGPWSDLASVVNDADDVSISKMKGLCDIVQVSDLLPYLESIEFDDLDWQDDLAQFRHVWDTFVDRYGFSDRTFGNFRQHIARSQRGDRLSEGVRLLTVHKAQGQEFRAVALAACNEGQFPDFRSRSAEEREAELRTFYVAITRPSRVLVLTRSQTRATRYGPRATEPSPFLNHVLSR
jgi:superfamily I DNA/RNA helicase